MAEISLTYEASLPAEIILTRLLTLAEARQESCQRLDATLHLVRHLAETLGEELDDWRLQPNGGYFDLHLEIKSANPRPRDV